tara:strand:- start:330 stop:1403 length:1074 start_codon:yes stop_codon:yes gene_type:complete
MKIKIVSSLKFYTFYLLYLLIAVFLIVEIICRILPTSTPLFLAPVSNKDDILRYHPNQNSTYSLGGNFYQVVDKVTNNYGFFSSFDYLEKSKPDLMIIGDSFIEAVQIKNEDTIGEIITKKSQNITVYQMGIGGVPLSQYIKMLHFAEKEFSPKEYIFVIVGNDFDESLCEVRVKEGTWCFNENYELIFTPFKGYSTKRWLARQLAFARYVVFNLSVEWRPIAAKIGITDPAMSADREFAGNTERNKSDKIINRSIKVLEEFFKELKDLGIDRKTTLIINADHEDVYNNLKTKSFFRNMRNALIKMAEFNNVKYIDMEPIFLSDYKVFSKKFDFPTDGHWNEYAHSLAAKAFLKQRQ